MFVLVAKGGRHAEKIFEYLKSVPGTVLTGNCSDRRVISALAFRNEKAFS